MPRVFGLKKVYNRQRVDNWSESANYGYFIGGSYSDIDRLDFSNDTISRPESNLTDTRYLVKGVSSSNYGYFAGGFNPSYVCTVDRIDFSNEIVSLPGNTSVTQARNRIGAVSNSNYSYLAGGESPSDVCTIDRLDFSNETVVVPPAGKQLTQARTTLPAVSNSDYGYFAYGRSQNCLIDRLDFSSETVMGTPVHGIGGTHRRNGAAAVSNSNYGYFAGGYEPPYLDIVDRIDFSNETMSQPNNNLSGVSQDAAGTSNLYHGYFIGVGPGFTCLVDRIDFSSETISAPGNNVPYQGTYFMAFSGGKSVNSKGVRKGSDRDGKGISSTYGYFAGGLSSTTGTLCTIDRIDFSSETVVTPGTYQLTKARSNNASSGLSNPNYGYFGGGTSPIPTPNSLSCTIDRIDFSNETVAVPPVGKELTQARSSLSTTSNSNYGYFAGGGTDVAKVCTIDRLDFSNETILIPASTSQLTEARRGFGAVSNSNYGYFGGGAVNPPLPTQVCTIDRIDFSTEVLAVPSVGKQLTQARNALAAVSNSNYGYFAGGYFYPPTTRLATIDRFDFSNETILIPASTPQLSEGRSGLAALSNSNYGYFAGGSDGLYVETIDRIDFSTESVTDAAPTELSATRISATGVSN